MKNFIFQSILLYRDCENEDFFMKKCFVLMLLAVILTGCVSYEYEGKKSTPTEQVTIYADSHSVSGKYTVLGVATVSGNYQSVSRQMLLGKLQTEAKKDGADGVILLEDRIIPGRSQSGQGLFYTAFDYDDMERSWRQVYRDTNVNFAGKDQTETITSYKRIIRAEFIKMTADK